MGVEYQQPQYKTLCKTHNKNFISLERIDITVLKLFENNKHMNNCYPQNVALSTQNLQPIQIPLISSSTKLIKIKENYLHHSCMSTPFHQQVST